MLNPFIGIVLSAALLFAGCTRETGGSASSPTAVPVASPASTSGGQPAAGQGTFPYEAEVFADKLNVPWELVFAPDGRIFFTERPGVIRVIDKGKLVDEPVFRFEPPFVSQGEGGLLGLALDPAFADNHYLYAYHSYEAGGVINNRVLRFVESNNKAKLDKVLLAQIPGNQTHNGGRLKFGPDGMLYATAGDSNDRPLAQNLNSLAGKILRLTADGSVPADNPFPGSYVYSWGHRNPQGLAWHPATGKLYESEHGLSAHDELNVIAPGQNYGWPTIQGDETPGLKQPDMLPPMLHSGDTTWAPSGIAFVTKGPWRGKLLVAALRGQQLLAVTLKEPDYTQVAGVEHLFQGQYGRLRDVVEGPDGSLYLLTNNRDGRGEPGPNDDRIIRLKPKA